MSSSPPPQTEPLHVTSHSVVSFDGTRIVYDVYDRPSRSLVLVIPGFWRDRKHPAMVRLAGLISTLGYRVAMIDVRGHGESEGVYGFNLNEHFDIAAVARDLLHRLPIESITLLGLSYGGAIAVSTAARHDLPISSVLLISSVADLNMIFPRINPFTIHHHIAFRQALHRPRFQWRLRGTARLRAIDDVEKVRVPICLIHVKGDWLVAHSHSEALHSRATGPKELHILDIAGKYHADRIFSVAPERIEPIVQDFLLRHTKP